MSRVFFRLVHTHIDLLWELHWYAPRTAFRLHRLGVLMRAWDIEQPGKTSRRSAVLNASRQLSP